MAIYKARAPSWKEKGPEFIETSMASQKCRFCKLNEEPLAETKFFRIMKARYPYLPEHAIAMSKSHARSIENFGKDEFADLIGIVERIGRLSPEIRFIANEGIAAGQTIPHMHMHIIRKFKENDLFVSRISAKAKFTDPFACIILHNAGLYGNSVSLEMSKEHADESMRKIKSMFARLSARYYYMMETRCVEAPEKYGKAISRMVNERIGHGMGINWSLENNGTRMAIIPRAIRQGDLDRGFRLGALELFLGLKSERNGDLNGNELGIWKERQESFHGEISRCFI
ncbi:MAG: HIT family protein [Candidatus Micrarchaeota archaeon]|nr:HIT family protein [Candidatus Micrarchaeota archaeon]